MAADAPLGRLIDIFESLVDSEVGIVGRVEEVRPEPGAPQFFHYAAQACDTRAFGRHANFRTTGGASSDRGRAIAKAVGEAVERYCSALYELDELPLYSSSAAPFAHVAPECFALYAEWQYAEAGFPWVPFTADTPIRWMPALDPSTGESSHVPAASVYVPYVFYRGGGDSPIMQPISTGLACHCSPAEAALSGLYETIERDAFTITWQAQLAMPQIRVETLPDEAYDLVQRFERTGGSVILFDLTLDHGIPTLLSVLRSPSPDSPALVFAGATSLDPTRAAIHALEELAHTRRYSQQIKSSTARLVVDSEYRNVIDQVDHLNLYADPDNSYLADFLFASSRRIDFSAILDNSTGDPSLDLGRALESIRTTGHRAYVTDVTTQDVAELGLSVMRVVIPGFHPLCMGHRIRALGGRRLWEVPKKLGFDTNRLPAEGNPAPHPYP